MYHRTSDSDPYTSYIIIYMRMYRRSTMVWDTPQKQLGEDKHLQQLAASRGPLSRCLPMCPDLPVHEYNTREENHMEPENGPDLTGRRFSSTTP